jgi:formylglycine-generating enzyme required for sulfatase activity
VNDGVEESPPSKPSLNGSSSAAAGLDPNDLFVNLSGANVGFKHWHPMPVTQNGGKLAGQGDMGGLWEWTSSTLEKQDGFEPMQLYPAYSSKFWKVPRGHVNLYTNLWSFISRLLRRQAQHRARRELGDSSAHGRSQDIVSSRNMPL